MTYGRWIDAGADDVVVIEQGVPIPPEGAGRGGFYPWREMEVGDSFAAELEEGKRVRAAASHAGVRLGLRFSVRRYEDEDGVLRLRVWRVA